jgi:SH3-like domain-containing protein
VDIFAPRGTPVVAATDGEVRRADTTAIGGRVVWLRDAHRRQSLYYAHLETILAPTGTRVRVGDTLGLVGNTGNARTTPPHLHFGIYSRGPIDPWHHLYQPAGTLQEVTVDLAAVGEWARVRTDEIDLRSAPHPRAEVLAELPRFTAFRVVGGAGAWYRVLLPDGSSGFLSGAVTEDIREPIRGEMAAGRLEIQSEPRPEAPVMAELSSGSPLSVLGTFNGFLYVQASGGKPGWVAAGR